MKDESENSKVNDEEPTTTSQDDTKDIDHPNVDSDPKDETNESEKEIEVTQNLDFNFVPYNEDVVITGSKGYSFIIVSLGIAKVFS